MVQLASTLPVKYPAARPHIQRICPGWWRCLLDAPHAAGFGATPKDAYDAWVRRDVLTRPHSTLSEYVIDG